MVQFSSDILSICKAYNVEVNDVILCFALASGAPAADAYIITHKTKTGTTQEQARQYCDDLLKHRPGLKIIINRIKNKRDPATLKRQEQQLLEQENQNITEEEKNELRTRSGLISKIIDNVLLTSGKEAVSGLQTLAKLQGLDSPEDNEQEEKRRYFLPWVSHCRSCELMKTYIKARNDLQGDGSK